MRSKIIVIVVLAALAVGCRKDNVKLKDDGCGENSGAQTLNHNNQSREYILYVPSSYDGNTKVPLLFNFHGFGGTASAHMAEADMRGLADAENFILVYPQGSCMDGSSHWNPSLPSSTNKSSADDLGFIEALINKLTTDYNIDDERIYACGYSNGSMFSYGLACYKSNLIAAIGSVSGAMLDTDCTPSHPLAVISIHGTSDGVIPYNGNADYNSVQTALNYWIGFNNTSTTPTVNTVNSGGTTIEHHVYANGDSATAVEHYKIVGGEHVWFNINYQGSGTNKLIWDFVSQYDIHGLR